MRTLLKKVDSVINKNKPSTMDDLITLVHSIEGIGKYGTSFRIVKYMGFTQGVRVYITGRKISHPLPSKDKVYSIFKGLDHFIKANWIEHQEQ